MFDINQISTKVKISFSRKNIWLVFLDFELALIFVSGVAWFRKEIGAFCQFKFSGKIMLKKSSIFVLLGLMCTNHVVAHEMKIDNKEGKVNLTLPKLNITHELDRTQKQDNDVSLINSQEISSSEMVTTLNPNEIKNGVKPHTFGQFFASEEVINYATSLTGLKYVTAGTSPDDGFDCSGFVYHVFEEITKMKLPRSANSMRGIGKALNKKDLRPGDLVFFNTTGRAFSHVGIYIGNDQFVHASSTARSVMISNLNHKYFTRNFNGARRVLSNAEQTLDRVSLNTKNTNVKAVDIQP